ncbi:MAG: hypothetical protein ACJAQU_000240 [Loktanella salsilacus]|jgi:hypothetical protein
MADRVRLQRALRQFSKSLKQVFRQRLTALQAKTPMLLGSRRCCLRTQVIVSRASLTSLRTVSDNTIFAKLTSVCSEVNVRSEPT